MPRGSRCRGCDFRSRCTCPISALAFVYPGIFKRTLGLEGVMPDETANLFEIMATTRSMRRLKPDPVPVELIRKILEAGVFAPAGGNMQRWRFLVVRDPKIKQTVGAYYKRTWDEVVAPRYRAGEPAPGTSPERFRRISTRPNIWPITSTKPRYGSCPVWVVALRPVHPAHRFTRRSRKCCWRGPPPLPAP